MISTTLTPVVAGKLQAYWWLFLLRGLLGIALGVFALMFPAATLGVVVILIAVYLLVDGIIAIVKAIQILRSHAHWWVLLLEGVLGIAVGIVIFASPGLSIVTLSLLVGFWAIFSGISAIGASLRVHTHLPGEWLYLVFGVVSLIFGVMVVFSPATGLVYMVLMISIYGFIMGITMIALAFRLRRLQAEPVNPA